MFGIVSKISPSKQLNSDFNIHLIFRIASFNIKPRDQYGTVHSLLKKLKILRC